MLPFHNLIQVDKRKRRALFLQVSDAIVGLIGKGLLPPKTKLPGSREMASALGINRQTAVAAYEELESQGWVEIKPQKGTFVAEELPLIDQRKLSKEASTIISPRKTGWDEFRDGIAKSKARLVIDRGSADDRLAPIESLSRAYRSALRASQRTRYLSNIDIYKLSQSEEIVSDYLNRTRGLRASKENIVLTQGSQMGIFLSANLLVGKDDIVVIGQTSYHGADNIFKHLGAQLVEVEVDENGLKVSDIEMMCTTQNIKCVYVTPHHHLPTTVTLSAGRRMRLLELANHFDFQILEDDYDFDYHYKSSPLLPLASADNNNRVIYVGSMSKNLAPGIRFGYLVASFEMVIRLKRFRTMVDRYGDLVVEKAIASMIKEGEIERHLRKSLKIYRKRRDYFCSLLKDKLGEKVRFRMPDGGLAVWCEIDPIYDLKKISQRALEKGLYISDGSIYNPGGKKINATRMGFASLNFEEMEEALEILAECFTR
ncbi:MAG: PLP-dependent aminotransferase family protein [Bacteroidota bacterium]